MGEKIAGWSKEVDLYLQINGGKITSSKGGILVGQIYLFPFLRTFHVIHCKFLEIVNPLCI